MRITDDQAPPEAEGRQHDDLRLVRGVRAHAPEALAEFTRRIACLRPILRALNARVGRPMGDDDLADLGQDALVVTWRKLESYDGVATLEGWLYRICYYVFLNRLRQLGTRANTRRRVPFPEDLAAKESADPWEYEDLHRQLEELPRELERILRLKHFEGLTFEQIGAALELSPNTVKSRYYKAREQLCARLSRAEGPS